jgi:hypothetical protein
MIDHPATTDSVSHQHEPNTGHVSETKSVQALVDFYEDHKDCVLITQLYANQFMYCIDHHQGILRVQVL